MIRLELSRWCSANQPNSALNLPLIDAGSKALRGQVKKRRRTEIKVEVEQTLILRQRSYPQLNWCERCGAQVRMLRPEDAAFISGHRPRTIYRLVEAGQVHFNETADGMLLVCLDSIQQASAGQEES